MAPVPVFSAAAVRQAVSPLDAFDAVEAAFRHFSEGTWTMQPKVYVTNYPAGDFRAMPALGDGHALLKWVTSFPANPARGLPTVSGVVLLSDAATGELVALLDAGAVTALRTAAAGVLAAGALGVKGSAFGVVGCGVNGAETVRLARARGHDVVVHDADPSRAAAVAAEHGAVSVPLAEALAQPVVVTVTPGKSVLFPAGSLLPGQHVSLMGADGPGKAEIAREELTRARLFCDDWAQASHGGELHAGVEAGLVRREDVTQLGDVLGGVAPGRLSDDEVTLFDSTGLAIQDLAIAKAALGRSEALDLPTVEL